MILSKKTVCDDIGYEISEYLPSESLVAFSKSCKAIYETTENERLARAIIACFESSKFKTEKIYNPGLQFYFDMVIAQDLKYLRGMTVNDRLLENEYRPGLYSLINKFTLQSVVLGSQNLAESFLKISPETLLENKAVVKDYAGKTISGVTPFQAALCVFDVAMVKMMLPFFSKIENGLDKITQQFDEIFPDGTDAKLEELKSQVFDFSPIIDEIFNYRFDDETKFSGFKIHDPVLDEKIERFRKDLKARSQGEGEKVFNPYNYICALKTFLSKKCITSRTGKTWFASYQSQKKAYTEVFGFTQRLLPACFIQIIIHGNAYLFPKGKIYRNERAKIHPRCRSLLTREKLDYSGPRGDLSIFPLSDNCGIGFDWVVPWYKYSNPDSPCGGGLVGSSFIEAKNNLELFETIIKVQNQDLNETIQKYLKEQRRCKPCCFM